MKFVRTRAAREEGFTLVDVMITVMLVGILASMAVFQIGSARPAIEADGAMRSLMGQLNLARERAISERRRIQIVPNDTDDRVQILRIALDDEEDPTELANVGFEGGVKIELPDGVGDTPDQFGNSGAVDFNGALFLYFNTDGTLIDASGDPVNGTIYLSLPDRANSVRAVTVQGAVGRIRGYRWNGATWSRS